MRHERVITGCGVPVEAAAAPIVRRHVVKPSVQWLAEELDRKNRLLESQMELVECYRGLHEKAIAAAGIGIWQCDLTDDTLTWTKGVYDLFGVTPDTRLYRAQTIEQYDQTSRDELERLRDVAIATGKGFSLDACICTPKGEERWLRLTAHVDMRDGRATRLYGVKQDITEHKRLLTRMQLLATTDPLTGLGNRTLFQFAFHEQRDWEQREVPVGALVLIDLDGFKEINDRHGHLAGDACLSAIATRLSQAFDDSSLIARIGGDEFAIALPAPVSVPEIANRMTCLKKITGAPVIWGDQFLPVGLSAGIAIPANPSFFDADDLFQRADAALYQAKQDKAELFRIADTDTRPHHPPASCSECSRTCEI